MFKMDGKTFKVILALCMIFGAVLVIVTCVWKLVKLVAKFKIEGRMEELEQLSKRKSESDDLNGVVVSPEEARRLRRLSILAGFDRKLSKSARSSFSDAVAGLRKPLKLLAPDSRNGKSELDTEMANHHNSQQVPPSSNGRIYANFLSPGSGDTHQPMAVSTPPQHHQKEDKILDLKDVSPSRRVPKLCAVHGSKVRSGSYTANKSPSPPPPPPPPPFASLSDCSDPGGGIRAKSPKSVIIPVHCINPNHYHHFHHHHDALSVTVNSAALAAAATSSSSSSCVICHLSSSLFHLHPSSIVSPGSSMKVEDHSPDERSDDEDHDEDEDDEEPDEDVEEDEELDLEASQAKCRELAAGTPPPPHTRSSFRDISGLREPLYSDGPTRSDITVHWNGAPRVSTPTLDLEK